MAGSRVKGKRIAALMTNGFEQVEFTSPREALSGEGAAVEIVSPADGEVLGLNHIDKADTFAVDVPIDEADPNDYDAVLLPGGVVNADSLRVDEQAQEFVRTMAEQGKPVFVICHGPWLLISAGLVRGKRMTSYHTLRDDMVNAGAEWMDEAVVTDGNFISSRHPGDLPAFNEHIIRMLAEVGERGAYRYVPMEGTE